VKEDPKEWKGHTYATIALAQRGDAKAVTALAKLLGSPKEAIRAAVLGAIGGRDLSPGEYWALTGLGYVASPAIATALEQYLTVETAKDAKVRAVKALGMTRSMLAATTR
jgi:HEAT repeat protein